jgi:hypothetical protein
MTSRKLQPKSLRSLIPAALVVVVALSSAALAVGQTESSKPVPPQVGTHVGDPAQTAPATPIGGNHEGIKMHGHWVIDVKNPDGTIAEHRDFENTIAGYGQELLAGLLSGYVVPSDYGIFLTTSGTVPCAVPQGFQGCVIVRSLTTLPASAICPYYTCFTGLTLTPTLIDNASSGSAIVLAGTFTATQGGTINGVTTIYGTCPANLSSVTGLATVTPTTCSTTPGVGGYRQLSQASITPVTVVTSQIVQVTVTITFS